MAASQLDALKGVKFFAIDAFDCIFPTIPSGFDPPGPMLETFKRLGIKHDTEKSWRIYRTLEHLLYRGQIPTNQLFWQLVLDHLEIHTGIGVHNQLMRAETAHYQFPGLALHEGAAAFLERLTYSNQVKTILWSNATWSGWETEVALGLDKLFLQRAISCHTGCVKAPFPNEKSLLRWTVEKFRIHMPSQKLVVVDDQLEYLRASHEEFGCRTVLVLNRNPEPTFKPGTFKPTLVISRLADLQKYLPERSK